MDCCLSGGAFEMQLDLSKGIGKTAGEILLSAVSVLYVAFNVVWFLPESDLRSKLVQPIKMWWQFWGLNQQWSLFSYGMSRYNQHTVMTLTFADGTMMLWEPPRVERMDLWDSFRLHRFRKWDIEYLPSERYKEYYADLARYIARLNYNPRNKPRIFEIHFYSVEIPPVDKVFVKRAQIPEHTEYSTIFVYKYTDKDCQ